MSAATKKKYVVQEIDELVLPEHSTFVARIVAGRGNNLHEVENAEGEKFLVSMPTKFRKNVWIKRGDYVLCVPIAEGDKVKAEISHILYKENIKYIKSRNLWPEKFADTVDTDKDVDDDLLPSSSSSSSSDSADDEDSETEETECEKAKYSGKNKSKQPV